MIDNSIGKETCLSVGAQLPTQDKGWLAKINWKIHKFTGDYPNMTAEEIMAAGVKPYAIDEFNGNCLLNGGINSLLVPALIGSATKFIDTTNGCIGVGDSSTAAAASQSALQAGTNHLWVIVTATTGSGADQKLVVAATFASAQANFAWNEICCGTTTTPSSLPADAATPPETDVVLNRLVSSMGTKASGATWTVTLTITFS